MFEEKYKPTNIRDFIGNKIAIKTLSTWLKKWNNKSQKSQKCSIVSGSSGVGKSTLIHLLIQECNYVMTEDPDVELQNVLLNKKNISVLPIDDYQTDKVKKSKIPIIFICNDTIKTYKKYDKKLCLEVKICKLTETELFPFIAKVIKNETTLGKINTKDIKQFIKTADGDVRFLLNQLQLNQNNGKKDDKPLNIFDSTKLLFGESDLETKYKTYLTEPELHLLMIHENHIANTKTIWVEPTVVMEHISKNSQLLSNCDVLDNWELEPYIACNAIFSTQQCSSTVVKFTDFYKNKNKKKTFNSPL